MALLFFDGFHGLHVNGNAAAGVSMRYTTNGQSGTGTAVLVNSTDPAPPSGGFALRNQGQSTPNAALLTRQAPAHQSGVFGVRFLPAYAANAISTGRFVGVIDQAGAVAHLNLTMTAAGAIEVRRGNQTGTILGTTAAGTVAAGVWAFMELKYIIDDTNGGVWLRVNGADALRLGVYAPTPTTLDTRNGGPTATVDTLSWYANNTNIPAINVALDEWYWCDLAGSAPYNDFLGDVRVVESLPDADGDATQWTPDTGNNWARVSDATGHDGDTSYVQSDTAGHEDLYNVTTPATAAGQILAAKVVTVARKTAAGDRALELSVKSGATTQRASVGNIADSFAEYTTTLLADPATSAPWAIGGTGSGLTDVQIGQRVPV